MKFVTKLNEIHSWKGFSLDSNICRQTLVYVWRLIIQQQKGLQTCEWLLQRDRWMESFKCCVSNSIHPWCALKSTFIKFIHFQFVLKGFVSSPAHHVITWVEGLTQSGEAETVKGRHGDLALLFFLLNFPELIFSSVILNVLVNNRRHIFSTSSHLQTVDLFY